MDAAEAIRKELSSLLGAQEELLKLVEDCKNTIAFGTKYQHWYSRAYKLVQSLAPERLAEFSSYYLIDPKRKLTDAGNYVIQDYVKAIGARTDHYDKPIWDVNNLTAIRFLNQVQIISSLSSRVGTVLQDVTGHLFAELQDSELAAASQLKKINLRAAGALAGVVLERHLQRVAENHNLAPSKKSPTIADLNDPLKQAGVYDVPTWRKIQLLADIRNICSHQKNADPTPEQVDELIAGTNAIIKSIF
ncbi:hypothetical protein NJF45_06110 [Stenotrophomonas maltophilia]|uniref:hypothetical protein n=1 Tax=Stenotrophomonas maltophilia TaxID=40324 RepID=UPI002096B396|nr:hypothetical protein [Stenotrophomonas maltophilia]MCO7461476.1 hypothetical protein [Stenotrophomonas maltophilia]